jgi:hypothetical protein
MVEPTQVQLNWALHHWQPDSVQLLPINESRKDDLALAKLQLQEAIEIESLYLNLIESHNHLELLAVENALQSLTHKQNIASWHYDIKKKFDLPVLTLLSSLRRYTDGCFIHLERGFAYKKEEFSATREELRGQSFSFCVMELLRNHAQHFGSGFHGFHLKSNRVENKFEEKSGLETNFEIMISPKTLSEDKGLHPHDQKTLDRLLQGDENLSLLHHSRGMICAISQTHAKFRQRLEPITSAAADQIRAAFAEYEAAFQFRPYNWLDIVLVKPDGSFEEALEISRHTASLHGEFLDRIRCPLHLSNAVIVTQASSRRD